MIYIGNVKMTPNPTPEEPWGFQSLAEAQAFATISYRYIWAAIAFDHEHVYQVFPGGRIIKKPFRRLAPDGTRLRGKNRARSGVSGLDLHGHS